MTPLSPRAGKGSSWGLGAILLLALAAYSQTLASSFHLDDYAIFADPYLTAPGGWWRVFRLEQTRPLTYLTFWLNYCLGEAQPWGYHAVNLVLHLAATAALFSVLPRIVGPRAALIGAALFALHPLQTEAVAYVFARATLLATLLCLVAWRSWLDGRVWPAAGWFALAVLAKEECVAFPVFLLGTEWIEGRWRRASWPPWLCMLGVSAAASGRLLYVAARTKGAGVGPALEGITPWTYLLTQARVIWRYLLLVVWPAGQSIDHDVKVFSHWDWLTVAGFLGLAVLVAASLRWVRAGGIWILGTLVLLAPSSSIVPAADLMFEHRMYLPMISLAVVAGLALARVRPPVLMATALAPTVASGWRARVWRSEESLWSDAAAKSPGSVRSRLQLARAVAATEPERARSLLLKARRLDPRNPETFTQMGTLLLDERDASGALAEFEEALRLQPASVDAHSNRGTALYLLARWEEAEAEFLRALELDPCHFNARHNLALLYSTAGAKTRRRTPPAPSNCRFTPAQQAELQGR
ncbi:MAG: tetratricopeptide repeat protein [Acidobacteria bacterium]|nr:tetratricopeptide repeat protein [Acidobacteriota bacterium]